MRPGGIGVIGTGTDATLRNMLRSSLASGKIGLLPAGPALVRRSHRGNRRRGWR